MSDDRIKLEPSWKARVGDYLQRDEMQALAAFLRQRKAAGAHVFPPGPELFAAFDATPFDATRVVILGQDPYHGPGGNTCAPAALRWRRNAASACISSRCR